MLGMQSRCLTRIKSGPIVARAAMRVSVSRSSPNVLLVLVFVLITGKSILVVWILLDDACLSGGWGGGAAL